MRLYLHRLPENFLIEGIDIINNLCCCLIKRPLDAVLTLKYRMMASGEKVVAIITVVSENIFDQRKCLSPIEYHSVQFISEIASADGGSIEE